MNIAYGNFLILLNVSKTEVILNEKFLRQNFRSKSLTIEDSEFQGDKREESFLQGKDNDYRFVTLINRKNIFGSGGYNHGISSN